MNRYKTYKKTVTQDAWMSGRYKKLSDSDMDLVDAFIKNNSELSFSDFEMKVNRLFMDKQQKPKNWTLILEILSGINSLCGVDK